VLPIALHLALLAAAPTTTSTAPSLAAPGFTALGVPKDRAQYYSDHLAQLLTLRGLRVLTAGDVRQLLGMERDRELMGCNEGASCIAELANALGTDGIVTGTVASVGGALHLDVRILATDGSRVLAAFSKQADDEKQLLDSLDAAAAAMAPAVFTALGKEVPAAAPVVSSSSSPPWPAIGVLVAGGALAVGASVMTYTTVTTYGAAVADYRAAPTQQSDNGAQLSWMSPLSDGLWVAAVVAAGAGVALLVVGGES
jgi:hypothetical protein